MTGLARWLRIALGVVVLTVPTRSDALEPQIFATTGAPDGPRTGLIVGQVVDANGAPIPDAIVRLTMPKFLDSLPTTPRGRVMADREGRYFFADLPPGEYFLQATKEGYAGGTYGQRRAAGQSQLFTLAAGERRADVTLTLWKYAVIAGTVVDEAGEPVVGVGVRALVKEVGGNRPRFGNESWLVPTAITDDRGMFRLAQLVPGTYVVVVPSTQTTMPASLLDAATQDAAFRSDLFFGGIMEVAPLGQPRTQQDGDFALVTLNRVLIPPPKTAAGRMLMYRTTYFPAARTAATASQITVESGEERSDLTIALRPVPAVRLSGRLVTPDGSVPPPTALRLAGEATADIIDSGLVSGTGPPTAGFGTASGMSDASGRFVLLGVPAGEYVLKNGDFFLSRAATQGRPAYWISQRITVGANDLSDLTVELRPALRLEGRIEFHGASGRLPVPSVMANTGITLETPFGEPGQFAVSAKNGATLSFTTVAGGGQYILRPLEINGWFVQSVMVDDKDITDRVFDLQSDTTTVVVTYTDRPSKVTGTVKDERGAIIPSAVAVAFPVDPERWSGYGSSPRILKSALTTRAGVYTFANLPAGDYYLAAIDGAESDTWRDPKTLEALASRATRVTIGAGDAAPRTIDLTVKAIR